MVEISQLKQYRDKVIELREGLVSHYIHNRVHEEIDAIIEDYNKYTLFIDNINKEIGKLEKPSKILRG